MRKTLKFAIALTAGIWCMVPPVVQAHSAGPPAGAVGPPLGDRSCASMGCHTSAGGGKGSVTLSSPNGLNYSPSLKQHMVLTIGDPTQQRWGFEASARPASNPSSGAAGDFASSDAFTQVICFDNSTKPVGQACPGLPNFQYVEHTAQGTRNGSNGGMTFEFDWTAPAEGVGDVLFYVGANAANGDGTEMGDHIYFKTFTLHQTVTGGAPMVGSMGVVNGASFVPGLTSGSWLSIQGENLARTIRSWTQADIVNGQLPTQLDGVSVLVDGKPAFVAYVSPVQTNVQAPADSGAGQVPVVVTTQAGSSATVMAQLQSVMPALFTYWGNQVAAAGPDGEVIGPSPNGGSIGGEIITLYGTGFGATTPPVPPGQVASENAVLLDAVNIAIGGIPAQVLFAGIAAGSAGVYQLNVQIPAGLPQGDLAVAIQYQGLQTSQAAFLRVLR